MLAFLLHPYGLAAIALVASLIGFQAWKVHYGSVKKQEGRVEIIDQSKKEAEKINGKIEKATRNITPESVDRELRKRYSRD